MKPARILTLTILCGALLSGCQGMSSLITGPQGSSLPGQTQGSASGQTSAAGTIPGQQTPGQTSYPASIPGSIPGTVPSTTPVATKSESELLVEQWGEKIYPGIVISGIKVGGLTYAEAEAKANEITTRVLARTIPFTVGTRKFAPTQSQLGLSVSFTAALASAQAAYRDLSVEERAQMIRTAPELRFELEMTMNDGVLSNYVNKVADQVYRKATTQVTGLSLLKQTLIDKLDGMIRYTTKSSASFKASVKTTPKLVAGVKEGQAIIAKGTSRYSESLIPRAYNVRLATKRINGTVVQPGEVFSVLRTIKAPIVANGYRISQVYSGDSLVEGSGGGVCQVSSTLYNAVVRAGLELVERHTHSFSVLYLPYGMDATIYAPSLDFKFRNTLDYPITIKGTAVDGRVTFSIISDEDAMGGISYKFTQTNIVEGEKHWKIKYTDDLDKGEEEILVYPHPKASVTVWRKTYKDGKLIKTILWDKVSYRELVGVKRVGR
ncbi:MAG: VanW family protein [Clostridiaceae bacterium]